MAARIKFLVKTYLWTLLVFIIAKVGFMLACHEGLVFTIADVWQVVTHGLTLDLSTALYFLIVPFLVTIVSVWWKNEKVLSGILYVYFVIVSLAFALAFVADSSLYPFWGFKLNASCLQYLETPTEAMASVSGSYLLWRMVAIAVIALLIFKGFRRKEKGECRVESVEFATAPDTSAEGTAVANSKLSTLNSKLNRLSETFFYVLLMPLMVIGIRGGIDESTTNVGQVYYSQNLFFNHSAVNPVFSFLSSFAHGEQEYYHYNYFEEAECEALLENVYTTESVGVDSLLTTRRPNVIIILLESCGTVFTELGGNKDVMPNLNRIASEGILFTQCYGNSWRTDRGTVCTLSGWPSFPSASVMKMPEKSQTMPSIAKTLKQEHYSTHYLYGGDINFTNMRGYLIATGWDHLTSMKDYTVEQQATSEWGVRDDITFETVYDMATKTSSPYLIGYSTLSSHEPWEVPVSQFDDKVLNSFYYLDQCIGSFIGKLKQSPVWDNLLVVMLADHGIKYKDLDETQLLRNLIPVVWTGGAIKAPRHIDKICNQSDLAATLLGQLGLPHDDFTFSRDVLSETYRYPMAVHNYNNAQSMVDSTGFILYDFDANQFLKREGSDAEHMLKVNKAILQKTTSNLKERQ